jgi:membrane fusion protein (multidrug efflux system)
MWYRANYVKVLLMAVSTVLMIGAVAQAQGPQATLVETKPMKTMEFHNQVTLVGRTEAKVHSRIVSEISGRVTAINAPEGNPIKKGEPLVSIDAERLKLDLQAKEAEAEQARAQASLAESNLKRVTELFGQELIPETTRDSAEAWVTIAKQRYRELQAERDQLAHDVEKSTIRAPYSGFTLRKLVDVGEWVDPGTAVYEMVDLSQVLVTVDLPERHYGHVDVGSGVIIEMSNGSPGPIVGQVSGIARSANESTHTFPVIVTVDNKKGVLGGGKLVRATLSLSDKFTSLAVPKDAIVRNDTRTVIYTTQDGKAAMLPVTIGSTEGDMVSVKGEGLTEGMPVVVRGNERIFPGSPVREAKAPSEESRAETESADEAGEN